ncbi:hypothetical protein QWZ10_08355 [Paracoccus cavernae]|uniref:Tetratricopeptide repeat protein n=1 Tax=Paracoccus cavernae TaxID=1571207 RepID=A0ABT8D7E8_9RHOB|nr:hypothetical protein [Paracoccus cavernae]
MKKTIDRGCFVAFRNDRLGGRLNSILTAMRLAKAYGTSFRIFWALSEGSSAELHFPQELFSAKFIADHFTSREEGQKLLSGSTDIGMIPRHSSAKDMAEKLARGTNYLSNSATEQILLPWETTDDLAILPDLLGDIEFSPTVTQAIALVNAKLDGLSFSSYHLRRGDIIDDKTVASHNLWSDKYIPRVIYEWHMKRTLAEGAKTLVIFTDEPREAKAFSGLSSQILGFDDLTGGIALTTIQRDFLELYTMSRSQEIYAPPSSAFSRLAAVIGNKHVTDIEADLTAQEKENAREELVRRLEHEPESFLSQSDAGQNLPFVAEHLEARGEHKRAISIAMNLVEGGMNRAYAYPFLSSRLLVQEDYKGCDQILKLMSRSLSLKEEHSSNVFLHAALGDLARDNWDRAVRRFHSGMWFFPINRLASQMFFYLHSMNKLTAENFVPFDPHLMRPAGHIFDESESTTHRLLMERLRDTGNIPQVYPANMEVRDWRILHGKKLSFRFTNKAKIAQQADLLATNLDKRNISPERIAALQSAVGAMQSDAGIRDSAEINLSGAIDVFPDNPLYRKRLADHLFSTDRPAEAIELLKQAWVLSGKNPSFQAALALGFQQLKDLDSYEELMSDLAERETPIVELQYLVVEAMRRNPAQLPAVQPYLDQLSSMAPGSHRVIALQAKVYEQLEKWDLAMTTLKLLETLGRPQSVVASKYTGLYKAYRRAKNDAAAQRWFKRNNVVALDV